MGRAIFIRNILFVGLLLMLVACGWQLRGTAELPPAMTTTYIEISTKTGELSRHLARVLRAANVNVISYPVDNAAVLSIQLSSGRRTVSVGPDGKAREYEVFVNASFSVSTADDSFALPEQQIKLTRDQVFDPLEVLAANTEQQILKDDMERQMARLIVDRIAAAYANSSK